MINPHGRFFFNKAGGEYGYSERILEVGIKQALAQIDFNEERFINRYPGGVE